MMKRTFVWAVLCLSLVLGTFLISGCAQPGETTLEGKVRHKRADRLNYQQMNQDIDRALLYDEPTRLTDKRLP